ncbi:hypothetical protein [Shimia sp.]|uniref:hypothetical protein n=1 Tax=Shimia sp. TaxID=1954381 RepID=UPI003BAC5C77
MKNRRLSGHRWALAFFCTLQIASLPLARISLAAMPEVPADAPLIIHNDRGGLLTDRIHQLRNLVTTQTPVEIRGEVCHSTCTMLLGLPDVCVSPNTRFGFHGPSKSGAPIKPEVFERASRVIASFYPNDLRDWYMSSARYHIAEHEEKTGAELIKLGIPRCANS